MTTSTPQPEAVMLSVVCPEDDLRYFCRRISHAISRAPWELTRALAVARQAHPQHPEAIGCLATVMHCEFRFTGGDHAADSDVEALVASLAGFESFGLQRTTVSRDPMTSLPPPPPSPR